MPWIAASAIKAAVRGPDASLSIGEEVGFLLLADLIKMVRDFHGAYLTTKRGA